MHVKRFDVTRIRCVACIYRRCCWLLLPTVEQNVYVTEKDGERVKSDGRKINVAVKRQRSVRQKQLKECKREK